MLFQVNKNLENNRKLGLTKKAMLKVNSLEI